MALRYIVNKLSCLLNSVIIGTFPNSTFNPNPVLMALGLELWHQAIFRGALALLLNRSLLIAFIDAIKVTATVWIKDPTKKVAPLVLWCNAK